MSNSARSYKEIVVGILAVIALGLAAIGIKGLNRERDKVSGELSSLVEQCMQKAAGEDRILTPTEGVKIARDLGYRGTILEGENIILRNKYIDPALLIGYQNSRLMSSQNRVKISISRSQMEEYLKSE